MECLRVCRRGCFEIRGKIPDECSDTAKNCWVQKSAYERDIISEKEYGYAKTRLPGKRTD